MSIANGEFFKMLRNPLLQIVHLKTHFSMSLNLSHKFDQYIIAWLHQTLSGLLCNYFRAMAPSQMFD